VEEAGAKKKKEKAASVILSSFSARAAPGVVLKAILKNGVIHPKEPVPSDWPEGTELEVQKSTNGAVEVEQRFRRLESQWRAARSSIPTRASSWAIRPCARLLQWARPWCRLSCVICRQSHRSWSGLPEITGENLAPPKVEGGFVKWNIPAQVETWLQWGRAKGAPMSEHLQALFPGLQSSPFRVTSPADGKYNCIAWAANDSSDWWWPTGDAPPVWPSTVVRELTLDAFTALLPRSATSACG